MTLLNEYKASLKNVAIEEYVDLVFFRPLGFLFVKGIYRTNLTPNQVTGLSAFVGIGSGISFAFGSKVAVAAGGLLLGISTVLDCADGQLARLKKNGTPIGRILDGVADYVYTLSAFIGIAIGCRTDDIGIFEWWLLALGAGISYAVQAGVLDYYRNEYLAQKEGKDGFLVDELRDASAEYAKYNSLRGHYFRKFLFTVYLKYSVIQNRAKLPKETAAKNERPGYVKINLPLLNLWRLNGTSTHIFILILCSFIGRMDLFLWYILLFGSLFASFLYAAQKFSEKEK
ncbi:MAG TPA: CDP-alcohol phosphatidyltransferase family protein [Bacteroidota bacterium]|nr:CDP-alcohol phosphatidyltransferase family protein [Bacteroidota bacterium]